MVGLIELMSGNVATAKNRLPVPFGVVTIIVYNGPGLRFVLNIALILELPFNINEVTVPGKPDIETEVAPVKPLPCICKFVAPAKALTQEIDGACANPEYL